MRFAIIIIGLEADVACWSDLLTRCSSQANRIFLSVFAGQTRPGPEFGTARETRFWPTKPIRALRILRGTSVWFFRLFRMSDMFELMANRCFWYTVQKSCRTPT